jgi:3-methyladenine DNA glycosylase AlkD
MKSNCKDLIERLQSLADPEVARSMARFGIKTETAYGVSVPALRKIAKEIGKDHALAGELWASGIHEARWLAIFIDNSDQVTEKQMDAWAKDFNSWDICDGCCSNLFDRTDYAYRKATEWSNREEEFVKRAGFALMAALAVHDKLAEDESFLEFLPITKQAASDGRNYVKKAINWALRQIGKRNLRLNEAAIKTALEIREIDSKSAKWIASDALRELRSEAVMKRLKSKKLSGRLA